MLQFLEVKAMLLDFYIPLLKFIYRKSLFKLLNFVLWQKAPLFLTKRTTLKLKNWLTHNSF